MDVSKNRGKTPKMDGEKRENPIRIDDLGVPLFLETPICPLQGFPSLLVGYPYPEYKELIGPWHIWNSKFFLVNHSEVIPVGQVGKSSHLFQFWRC